MLKLSKLFIAALAMTVTFGANAQVTDTTRAQGWYDFMSAALALPSPVYYTTSDINVNARLNTSAVNYNFVPHRFDVDNSDTASTTAAAGRTRFIEFTEDLETLFDTHLNGKVSTAERDTARGALITGPRLGGPILNKKVGFSATDLETRRTAALAAGAVDPNAPPVVVNPPAPNPNPQPNPNPTNTPTATSGGGGSSGGGAVLAVAALGGAYYYWKKYYPTAKVTFAAMPTDTDAYVAQFNAKPKDNLSVNLRYSEGNLFADSDIIKPETSSTVMATVKWTW